MKDPTLTWLLDRRDPSVRHQVLIDLLHRPKDARDVLATRDRIPSYRPVKKILATQTREGVWSTKKTSYLPNWTSEVCPLALHAEKDAPPEACNRSECERFLYLHQTVSGASPAR